MRAGRATTAPPTQCPDFARDRSLNRCPHGFGLDVAWLVLTIFRDRILELVGTREVATRAQIIYCTNVLGEEKVQCPIKCDANLFVQAGQLAQVNRPPHPPGEEAREIETEDARHACPTTD